MGFFDTSTMITSEYVGTSKLIEVGTTVTFPFYIIDVLNDADLTSVEYRIVSTAGRDTNVLQSWTSLTLPAGDVYMVDVLLTGVATKLDVKIEFRILDELGIETYLEVNGFKTI